ncbi:class I SAM-dependent methyltransferase [Rhodanobacter sp. UC4450_H17]
MAIPTSPSIQEQNRQRFNVIAADWDESPRRRELASAVAASIEAAVPLQADWEAMEYGCGTGLVGATLAPKLGRLLACDVSPGMLAVLEAKAGAAGLDNLQACVLDLTSEPPPAQPFDFIFSSMTMHHIPDVPELLRTFHSMLKPGGWLALADLDAEDGTFHEGGVSGVMHHGFDRDAFQAELEAAGFLQARACTACVVSRPAAEGRHSDYPVFLVTARA